MHFLRGTVVRDCDLVAAKGRARTRTKTTTICQLFVKFSATELALFRVLFLGCKSFSELAVSFLGAGIRLSSDRVPAQGVVANTLGLHCQGAVGFAGEGVDHGSPQLLARAGRSVYSTFGPMWLSKMRRWAS
jgi:hypothetical protein